MNQTSVSFRGSARLLAAGITLLTLLCVFAYAQETTGSIIGVVTDPSGAAVPNAKITLSGVSIPRPIIVSSDTQGNFQMQQIAPGSYTVDVVASGFRAVKKTDVPVILGRASRLDTKLEVGQMTESVVVSADAVMVDVTSSSSAINIDKSFFDMIPKGRSFYDLIGITPGARNESKTGGYQVDGASGSENTYYLDGMEVTNVQTGVLNSQNRVPVEMVQQLQVKNGVMEAQYGGAMGGVVNAVVRSGTNQFHGEAGFYFNNDSMWARPRPTQRLDPYDDNLSDYFQNPQDSFQTWNPVVSIGGPILKNRLFFFAGWMPTTTNTDRTVKFNSGETGTYNTKVQQNYTVGKLDFVPANKIRMNASWIWNPSYTRGNLPARDGTSAYNFPWGAVGDYNAGNIISGQIDYIATSKLVISFRGGYASTNSKSTYGLPSTTAIYYSGASTTVPPADLQAANGWISQSSAARSFDFYQRVNLNADLTYLANWHGQHNLKGGWQANQLSNSVKNLSYPNGYYRYYWNLAWPCITSQCSGSQRGTYGYYRYYIYGDLGDASSDNQGLFIQDNWRVNKYLTLNLGLRTEREFLPSFSSGTAVAAPPIEFSWSQKLSPRLGMAWDPFGNGKQRLYASFGYFYDVMKYEMPRGSFGGATYKTYYFALDDPNVVRTNQGIPADPTKLPGKFFEVVDWRIPSNDPNNNTVDPNLKPMKQRMLDIGYDYSVTPTLVASLRYTNRRLIRTIEDVGTLTSEGEVYFIANPGEGLVADPKTWSKGYPTTPKAVRDYDAVEIRLDQRMSKNFQFAASYTYSRSYGNYSGLASSDEDGRTSPNVNRYFDLPYSGLNESGMYAFGPLATDRPNTFKFFGSYTASSKLGQTTLSPNVAVYSGTPITTEANLISSTPGYPYGRGNLGRTPVFSNFDINLMQDFKPFKNHESMRFRFEFSVFNLFNQSTVMNKYPSIIHANDGQITFNEDVDVFSGYNTKALMQAQDLRVDPRYNQASAFQGPRNLRLQLSFHF